MGERLVVECTLVYRWVFVLGLVVRTAKRNAKFLLCVLGNLILIGILSLFCGHIGFGIAFLMAVVWTYQQWEHTPKSPKASVSLSYADKGTIRTSAAISFVITVALFMSSYSQNAHWKAPATIPFNPIIQKLF